MVPMRLEVSDARPLRSDFPRPRLVLQDVSAAPVPRRRAKRSPLKRMETVLGIAAAAAVLLYFLIGFAASLVHAVQQSYFPASAPAVVTISKTVTRGMTLTQLARQYGDPNTYILEREEQIARANHLSGTAPLYPGQHLQIPVTNPVVIARIQQNFHHTRVASRTGS